MPVLQHGIRRRTEGQEDTNQHDPDRRPAGEPRRGKGQRHPQDGVALPHGAASGEAMPENPRTHH